MTKTIECVERLQAVVDELTAEGASQTVIVAALTLRYLLRIAKDLHLISVDSYTSASGRIEEIGRMTAGWRRSLP